MTAPRVKICGLTRRRDVAAAVAAGADALGFVFTRRSKRFVETDAAAELVAGVPAFLSGVGLFMDQEAEEVRQVLRRARLSLLQFHGREDAAYCRQFGLPWMKAVSMDSAQVAERACRDFPDAAALLLDSHPAGGAGGTGVAFDWALVPELPVAVVLAGGLTPDNVARAVREVRPWAVDVSSGVEDAPGIKNPELIEKFIEEAKREY